MRARTSPCAACRCIATKAYLSKLIRKGFKVAVCEQMEDPAEAKKRGAKSVVERGVVRVVTPGTMTEDALLDARRHNYLAALAEAHGRLGLAWIDMSTGDFQVQPVSHRDRRRRALARLAPGELLVPERLMAQPGAVRDLCANGAASCRRCRRPGSIPRMPGRRLETAFMVSAPWTASAPSPGPSWPPAALWSITSS